MKGGGGIKIKVYQLNSKRDAYGVKFFGLLETKNIMRAKGFDTLIRSENYDEVYSGDVDCHTLEEVYTIFNLNHPPFHRGHSMAISDVTQIIEAPELAGRIKFYREDGGFDNEISYVDNKRYNNAISKAHEEGRKIMALRLKDHHLPSVANGFYFCDSVGFASVPFNPALTKKPQDMLRVVAKEPGKPAYEAYVQNELCAFKQAVNGHIQVFCPFDDKALIICNEEGKLLRMEPNCFIGGDLLVGTIFVIGDKGNGEFGSLSKSQAEKYLGVLNKAAVMIEESPEPDEGMYPEGMRMI